MQHDMSGVLKQLEAITQSGKAPWKVSGRAAELVLPLGGMVIMLSKNPFTELFNPSKPGPFRLSVLSESGTEFASLEASSGDPQFNRLKVLFDLASQKAKAVGDLLEDVSERLAQLESA